MNTLRVKDYMYNVHAQFLEHYISATCHFHCFVIILREKNAYFLIKLALSRLIMAQVIIEFLLGCFQKRYQFFSLIKHM